jgi:hypothetical protein
VVVGAVVGFEGELRTCGDANGATSIDAVATRRVLITCYCHVVNKYTVTCFKRTRENFSVPQYCKHFYVLPQNHETAT